MSVIVDSNPEIKRIQKKRFYKGIVTGSVNLNSETSNKRLTILLSKVWGCWLFTEMLWALYRSTSHISLTVFFAHTVKSRYNNYHSKITAPHGAALQYHLNISYLLKSTIKQYASFNKSWYTRLQIKSLWFVMNLSFTEQHTIYWK